MSKPAHSNFAHESPVDGAPAGLDFSAVVTTLGATPNKVNARQHRELDELGYTIIPNLIGPEWLVELREAFDRIYEEEGDQAGREVSNVPGVRRLADLVNKSPVFDRIWLNPEVLAAAHHLIVRPFKLHSLNGHDPRPAHGAQPLHTDTSEPRQSVQQCHVVNSMWMLDDVSPDNGATRVVPASHRLSSHPRQAMVDPGAPHADETYLTGPAGTVAVFNGHLWHSCTTNRTTRTRRLVHCAFIGRELPQQTDQRRYLREATARRLSPAARLILDV
jgi:ectoine hydroxylase-related dioxygenase (phytanoyl-CoA dioxygenase family)